MSILCYIKKNNKKLSFRLEQVSSVHIVSSCLCQITLFCYFDVFFTYIVTSFHQINAQDATQHTDSLITTVRKELEGISCIRDIYEGIKCIYHRYMRYADCKLQTATTYLSQPSFFHTCLYISFPNFNHNNKVL